MKHHKIMPGAVCLAVLLHGGPSLADDPVAIPFHLGKGQMLYERYCSACHGAELTGSEQGPPLLHPYYKPSHHGDESFYRAALQGVKQHHWDFGDMPPVVGMTRSKMDHVVPYIRFYQQQKKLY